MGPMKLAVSRLIALWIQEGRGFQHVGAVENRGEFRSFSMGGTREPSSAALEA